MSGPACPMNPLPSCAGGPGSSTSTSALLVGRRYQHESARLRGWSCDWGRGDRPGGNGGGIFRPANGERAAAARAPAGRGRRIEFAADSGSRQDTAAARRRPSVTPVVRAAGRGPDSLQPPARQPPSGLSKLHRHRRGRSGTWQQHLPALQHGRPWRAGRAEPHAGREAATGAAERRGRAGWRGPRGADRSRLLRDPRSLAAQHVLAGDRRRGTADRRASTRSRKSSGCRSSL